MKTKEELESSCAEMLKKLRESQGLSKAKMADALYIDAHTWASWESGKSAPTAPELIWIFNTFHADAMKSILEAIYPEVNVSPYSDVDTIKNALIHYLNNAASDRIVRELYFLLLGGHGSNIEPQLQEFTMINHLPLICRTIIAEQVLTLWELTAQNNRILYKDHIMPDIDYVQAAVSKAKESIIVNSDSYTTGVI